MVLSVSFIAGFRIEDLSGIPVALMFMLLISLLFTALGTAIASVLDDMQGFQLIMNFLVQLLMPYGMLLPA